LFSCLHTCAYDTTTGGELLKREGLKLLFSLENRL